MLTFNFLITEYHQSLTDKKDSSPTSKERRAPRRRLTQNNSALRGSFTTSLQNVLEDEPTQTNDHNDLSNSDLGKSHEMFVASNNNNDTSSQSTEDTTTNNNNYRPQERRQNRHLMGKSGRINKSLVQSLKFDSIFSSQSTRNSSSCPSNMQNHESINVMDFGVSEDIVNASFNLSDPSSNAASTPSNASNNMSYLVDSDNFMGWNGSRGNDSSLSNLVDSQGFLNWNAADSQEEDVAGGQSKDEEDTTEEQNDTITPIEDEHGGKLSKSSSTSSTTENVLTKQMKRLSSTLSTATKRSSWDTHGTNRRGSDMSSELSDVEDNESFAMPRFNKEDEHVDIGELRKDLIAAAKKESDEGGKKNTLLKRVSTLLEQSG